MQTLLADDLRILIINTQKVVKLFYNLLYTGNDAIASFQVNNKFHVY